MTARKFFLFLAIVVLPGGCFQGHGGRIATQQILFLVDARVNDGYPVEVDIVFVFDEGLAKELGAYSAQSWFQRKQTLSASHAGTIAVRHFQVPPGLPPETIEVTNRQRNAVACFVFANYVAHGEHRLRLDNDRDPTIILGPKAITVSNVP